MRINVKGQCVCACGVPRNVISHKGMHAPGVTLLMFAEVLHRWGHKAQGLSLICKHKPGRIVLVTKDVLVLRLYDPGSVGTTATSWRH